MEELVQEVPGLQDVHPVTQANIYRNVVKFVLQNCMS